MTTLETVNTLQQYFAKFRIWGKVLKKKMAFSKINQIRFQLGIG